MSDELKAECWQILVRAHKAERQVSELLAVLKEAENALAEYIPSLERHGASLNYGKAVLEAARELIARVEKYK